jgi:hypothetical protein
MKKIIVNSLNILTIVFFLSISVSGISQPPPPPPTGSNTQGNKLNGGGAPIGGGLFILLGLAAAYGGRKLYNTRKEKLED